MPTYISLLNWTPKGIESIRESPSRVDAGRELFRKLGGDLKAFYLTMGRYDMVSIFEAPDDATLARGGLTLASRGNVRTETLRAFTEEEYRRIIQTLP